MAKVDTLLVSILLLFLWLSVGVYANQQDGSAVPIPSCGEREEVDNILKSLDRIKRLNYAKANCTLERYAPKNLHKGGNCTLCVDGFWCVDKHICVVDTLLVFLGVRPPQAVEEKKEKLDPDDSSAPNGNDENPLPASDAPAAPSGPKQKQPDDAIKTPGGNVKDSSPDVVQHQISTKGTSNTKINRKNEVADTEQPTDQQRSISRRPFTLIRSMDAILFFVVV
ncbi:hypothetical protein Tb927.3.5670 [Trypanosoma brucei brucei TREU927]|uniref:Uncharacterized protein n=1 Tax=Trypanosoma brucei brucei (strain 927/4 GUTat10.1) TaxID=185431 RepID=Q57VH6_TRYB2|nr:hypothetical protein Tb927.3.5670 [Trypanosoma brucei brucei TREU927]AAX70393.1 hypothetical protein Tb927.3.5670 [Trypanosoma brucei]AAZ10598.1 hypothetical protein Tb927.3.5670 [Trypanosoma brucei brucei TREU927]